MWKLTVLPTSCSICLNLLHNTSPKGGGRVFFGVYVPLVFENEVQGAEFFLQNVCRTEIFLSL